MIQKIILPKYLKDFLTENSQVLDSSVNDSIRLIMCTGLLYLFKWNSSVLKELEEHVDGCKIGCFDIEKRAKLLDNLIVECNKLIEYNGAQKEQKKFF